MLMREKINMACISPEQQRQKDEAKRESIEKSYNVCATGEKKASDYDEFANLVNNE
jgi:hypothetical protein